MGFPPDFVWGAATAAYQIEGAVNHDGRVPSIWDTFSHIPGNIANDDTGDIACDHYHRYREDIKLISDLGVQSYRFSIAWPRIIPQPGQVNQAGLDFYSRLVDELHQHNIEPCVTLYHWDLPQWCQDTGGWANREVIDYFAEYTQVVTQSLGDRVSWWITLNEPWVFTFAGYHFGGHAPGIKDLKTAVQASHHALLAHGTSIPIIRQNIHDAQVGITLDMYQVIPAFDSKQDREAAYRFDGYHNRWFADPVFGKGYPDDMLDAFAESQPIIGAGDLTTIATEIDFLGINTYFPMVIQAADIEENDLGFKPLTPSELQGRGYSLTHMDWPIHPDAFRQLLFDVYERYRPRKIFITENGAAFPDELKDGKVNDPERVDYIKSYIDAMGEAIDAGVPVKGYFVWSLLDNFQWALGYEKRFGIIYVDYATLQRIPKGSYEWYRNFIHQQRKSTS